MIHSFRSLSYDRSVASSTTISPQSEISASSFNLQYPVFSLRSFSCCLRLLRRLPLTSILQHQSIVSCKNVFLCKKSFILLRRDYRFPLTKWQIGCRPQNIENHGISCYVQISIDYRLNHWLLNCATRSARDHQIAKIMVNIKYTEFTIWYYVLERNTKLHYLYHIFNLYRGSKLHALSLLQ
jgi:hypothetical protein